MALIGDISKITTLTGDTYNVKDASAREQIDSISDSTSKIENLATIEGHVASKNYTIGEYVIIDGDLYRTTQNVSYGAQFKPNVNIVKTSVTEELEAILMHINATVVEMTLAEYNALTEEQKMDGTIRYITDSNSIPSSEGVRY